MSNKAQSVDWNELIPELKKEWSPETGWRFILGASSRIELALLYAELFWPTFIEYDGMVLLADHHLTETTDQWLSATSNDRTKVEKVVNHAHLFEIHEPGNGTLTVLATPTQLEALGEKLKRTWAAKLAIDFPDRTFDVALFGDPHNDMSDYQITFWERRGAQTQRSVGT